MKPKSLEYWLSKMEPEDAAKLREWARPEALEANNVYDSISNVISEITPQWQTLPGGFWEWRAMHNKYVPHNLQMHGIYEADPYPSQSRYFSTGGLSEMYLRRSSPSARRD